MLRLSYLAVLAGCFLGTLWLEFVLKVAVYRRWRRLLLALTPTVLIFVAWDVAAIAAGHWSYDQRQMTGILLPGGLPVEELLFFLVVPTSGILAFEAVRAVRGWPAGDEAPPRRGHAPAPPGAEEVGGVPGAEAAGGAGRGGTREPGPAR